MATFGEEGVGGVSTTIGERIFASKFTLTENADLYNISVRMHTAAGASKYKVQAYDDNAGEPNNLEAESAEYDFAETGYVWRDFTITGSILAGVKHLAIESDGANTALIYYAVGSVAQTHYKTISYPTTPNPFGASNALDRVYSIHADYTPTPAAVGGATKRHTSLLLTLGILNRKLEAHMLKRFQV